MDKAIQIPMELFDDLCIYFLQPSADADYEADLWDRIHDRLADKLDKKIRHDLYTQFRRAPTPEERERARLAYLHAVGMPESFRSPVPPYPFS